MKSVKIVLLWMFFSVMSLIMLNCGSATEPEEGDFPTNLNVEKHSNFSVKLFWEYEAADSDTIFYQIARKVGIAEWVENYAQISSDFNEFIDYIPTTSNNVYAYKVRYFNSTLDITSPYSETIAWFSENTYPSDMLIIQLTQETIQVTWSDNCQGEEGYIVDKKLNDAEWENNYLILEPNTTSFLDNAALFDSISYRIFAYVGVSQTELLTNSHFTTLLSPSDLLLSVPDVNKIRLNWQDNSASEEGFYIDKKIGQQEWLTRYASVDSNVTTFVDDNLLPCGTLLYRVQAFKDGFVSGFSNSQTINVNLQILSSFPTPGNALEISMPIGNAYIPEWTAFIADGYEGLAVVDCLNPSGPSSIVTYQDLWGDRTLASFVHGNFVYVATQSLANAEGGIQKVDISDFQNPVISNVTATSGVPKDLYVDGDFAYLAEGESGMSIMYVASSYPAFVANIDLFDARNIHVIQTQMGVFALVANGLNGGIVIFDVSDPYNPALLSELPIDGLAADVHAQGNFAFLANGEEGLAVIDISDLYNPQLINSVLTEGFVNGVFSDDDHIYITDYEKGFYVIDFSSPPDSYILGFLEMESQPVSVHLSGSYAYLTDNQGLKIIKIKP